MTCDREKQSKWIELQLSSAESGVEVLLAFRKSYVLVSKVALNLTGISVKFSSSTTYIRN